MGEHWGTVSPVEIKILTLTQWVLHEKIKKLVPRLGGDVPPLVSRDAGTGGGGGDSESNFPPTSPTPTKSGTS